MTEFGNQLRETLESVGRHAPAVVVPNIIPEAQPPLPIDLEDTARKQRLIELSSDVAATIRQDMLVASEIFNEFGIEPERKVPNYRIESFGSLHVFDKSPHSIFGRLAFKSPLVRNYPDFVKVWFLEVTTAERFRYSEGSSGVWSHGEAGPAGGEYGGGYSRCGYSSISLMLGRSGLIRAFELSCGEATIGVDSTERSEESDENFEVMVRGNARPYEIRVATDSDLAPVTLLDLEIGEVSSQPRVACFRQIIEKIAQRGSANPLG